MAEKEDQIETTAAATETPSAAEPKDTALTSEEKAKALYDIDEPTEISPDDSKDKGGEEIPAKPEAAKPDKPGTEQPVFDDQLLARAEKLGIPKDDVQSFGTPEAATRALNLLEKRLAQPPAGEGSKPTAAGQPTPPESEFKPFEIKLDPNQYDPEIIATMNGINEHYAGHISKLQGQLEQALGAVRNTQAEQFANSFDTEVGKLGAGYTDLLGEGPTGALDQKSETFGNRKKLLDEMEVIAAGYVSTGKQVPQMAEIFSKAVSSVFKDKQKTLARKEISEKLKNRQFINRPGAQRGKDISPEQAAKQYVQSFLADHGEAEDTVASASEF